MKIQVAILAMLLIVIAPTIGSAQEPDWREQLNEQALSQEQCDIQYLTNVTEKPVAGQPSIAARIHCADGRSFDIVRLGDAKAFDIRECAVTAC